MPKPGGMAGGGIGFYGPSSYFFVRWDPTVECGWGGGGDVAGSIGPGVLAQKLRHKGARAQPGKRELRKLQRSLAEHLTKQKPLETSGASVPSDCWGNR
ncbi:MAG: hypothetical protein ACUVRV_12635 [Cyanobacteriota bacterium]